LIAANPNTLQQIGSEMHGLEKGASHRRCFAKLYLPNTQGYEALFYNCVA